MHRSEERRHSITSSARASSVAGTSRPSALAVLRLTTSSYLVGACTGRSAGFSPFRIQRILLGLGHPDFLQCPLGFRLLALRQFVQHIGGLVDPAALAARL